MMIKESRYRRPIIFWLGVCFLTLIGMVFLGGMTRLNEAGLSIVDWKPLSGIVPPMNEAAWLQEFEHYKAFPEYQHKHYGMELEAFKFIFWLEYSHRLLGRVLGLFFILPLFFFWRTFFPALKRRLLFLLGVGGLQGVIGWYMVKSGLVHNPYVSHYRLALHLGLAFIVLFLFIEILLSLYPQSKTFDYTFKKITRIALLSVALTIIYGAFVAGLRAGKLYDTFPLMGGEWIPSEWLFYKPILLNFVENPATVQWLHRVLAFVSLGVILLLAYRLWGKAYIAESILVTAMGALQLCLGIATVLLIVPISIALLHQLGAVLLFSYLSTLYLRSARQD